MRVLVVYCHPNPRSFTHAVLESVHAGLARSGCEVQTLDLYGSGFKTKARQLGPESQKVLTALGRQALHAYLLVLEHPGTGEILHWESGLPEDLVLLEAALRRID